MIHLFIIDIERAKTALLKDGSIIDNESTSKIIKDGIINTNIKNKDTLYTSFCSYLSLDYAFEKIYKQQIPKIIKDSNGKPCFVKAAGGNKLPLFNISHSENMVAICFYDGIDNNELDYLKLGVDIQHHKHLLNKELIEAKMPKNVNNCCQNNAKTDILIDFYELSLDENKLEKTIGFSSFATDLKEGDNECFFDKWVRTEALMKADGGGFKAFPHILTLFSQALVLSYEFTYSGEKYSIALALL